MFTRTFGRLPDDRALFADGALFRSESREFPVNGVGQILPKYAVAL
jgi:hypothetical protein